MEKKGQQTPPPFPVQNVPNPTEIVKSLEKEVLDLLRQKQAIDKKIVDIEYKLYQSEGAYFEETLNSGNILKGFEGYQGVRTDRKRPKGFGLEDRIFSLSSSTYQQSLELKKNELDHYEHMDSGTAPSAYGMLYSTTKKKKLSPSTTSPIKTPKKRGQGQKRSARVAALTEESASNGGVGRCN